MTCAAILSWADFRDTPRRAERRPWRHDRFDPWLHPLENCRQDRTPTWEALTQAVFALRPAGTQAVAAGVTVWDGAPTPAALVPTSAAGAAGQTWRPLVVLALAGAAVPTRPATATGRRPGRKPARATRARWTGAGREAQGGR